MPWSATRRKPQSYTHFNDQHPAIKLELEKCQEKSTTSLCLFDLSVKIKADGEATFDFYTKAAKSEIFLHKQSALPWSQKTAAIRNELKRIETRSGTNTTSNKAAFEEKLRSNGYHEDDSKACSRTRRRKPNRSQGRGAVHYIHLPFLGESANRVRS